jgi:hypothetical protein
MVVVSRSGIVKVFKSAESAISSVCDTFPATLSVITTLRSSTRRIAEEAPRTAFDQHSAQALSGDIAPFPLR